nr:MAG: hypothetical protein [Caudoviricetes sp.]
MKFFRTSVVPVIWRKTVTDKLIPNLYSGLSLDVKYCPSCKQYHPKVDFYFESRSKKKFPEQLRSICIRCFDKPKPSNVESSSLTLEEFW